MTAPEMPENEGWKHLINSPKWHYFREGRSLCGRWATFGKGCCERGNNFSPDNCATCRKKVLKKLAKLGRDGR